MSERKTSLPSYLSTCLSTYAMNLDNEEKKSGKRSWVLISLDGRHLGYSLVNNIQQEKCSSEVMHLDSVIAFGANGEAREGGTWEIREVTGKK